MKVCRDLGHEHHQGCIWASSDGAGAGVGASAIAGEGSLPKTIVLCTASGKMIRSTSLAQDPEPDLHGYEVVVNGLTDGGDGPQRKNTLWTWHFLDPRSGGEVPCAGAATPRWLGCWLEEKRFARGVVGAPFPNPPFHAQMTGIPDGPMGSLDGPTGGGGGPWVLQYR